MNTYLIKRNNCLEDLKNVLERRGNWQEYQKGDLDFLDFAGEGYGRNMTYWRKKSVIKIGLDSLKNIYNKGVINNNILKSNPNLSKYVIFSRFIDVVSIYKNFKNIDKYTSAFGQRQEGYEYLHNQYLKPVTGFAGTGIEVVTDFEDFKKTIKQIIKRNKKNWDKKIYKVKGWSERYWTMQVYRAPQSLMLYEGKKFHFRVYYIIIMGKEGQKAFIYNRFPLAIARKKFVLGNFKDHEIHDTHFYENVKKNYWLDIYFKDNYDDKKYRYVVYQIKELFKEITELSNASCYEESKYCYQIFAADMFVYNDFSVKMIELNNSPSFREKTLKYEDIFEGIAYHLVDPIYPPKNKVKKYTNFIEI